MTIRKKEIELEVVPQGFELTQYQKDTISRLQCLVQGGKIPPVEVYPDEDGSMLILPPKQEEIAGVSAPRHQLIKLEDMA